MEKDLAKAIREREDAIAQRARHLAEEAVSARSSWAKGFGLPPTNPVIAEAWWERLAIIAAYRDRWRVTTLTILGDEASIGPAQQASHRHRARRAGQEALVLQGIAPRLAAPTSAAFSAEVDHGVEM